MLYFQSWSGGKDSTASIILEHIHGLPRSTIIFSEVMFDKQRGISGEMPEHIDWVRNTAIPIFEKWGHEVKILHADTDYLDWFYRVLKTSKVPERIGKIYGFPIGRFCKINSAVKIKPINEFYKQITDEFIQYVGIAADEPERLARMQGTNRISLLERYGYTEQMALDLCKDHGLLSPVYAFTKRGGCWFCPNASIAEYAHLKQLYPHLWAELETLSRNKNLCVQKFRYSKTFEEVNNSVDALIEKERIKNLQITLEEWSGDNDI